MEGQAADAAISEFIQEICRKLDHAVSIAKAANACASSGSPPQAVSILLDIEQLLYEANTLLNAVSLINRLAHA